MKTPKNAASDTLIRRVRGAGPDGRARTEGKDKSVPVPHRHGSFRGKTRGHPSGRSGAKKVSNEKRRYGPRVALRTVWGCQVGSGACDATGAKFGVVPAIVA